MRFTFGAPSNLQTLLPTGWREVPALGEKRVQNYGLVASCLGMLLVSILLRGAFVPRGFLLPVLILLLTMPIHEFIHALSTPNWGFSTKTIVGLQKSKGVFMPYVYYDGEQSLWRFFLTGFAPTILLTVVPIMVVMLLPLSDSYRVGFGFLSFFNAAISGGDMSICIWLATRLDPRSSIRQNGWKLYWKTTI